MNISVKSEYALKALFDLAFQQMSCTAGNNRYSGPVKIADIARRQRIPQKFLELILSGLKQSGFVDSRRGAEGGYLLARPPDGMTVGEVLRAIENIKSSGQSQLGDPFSEVWQRVDSAVSNVLDRTTFAELAREWQDKSTQYVPNWDI